MSAYPSVLQHRWRTIARLGGLAAVALAYFTASAMAQQWPARAVTFVVPFVPGGATDVLGRLYSDRLGAVLGQPVIIDNKPGAGGNVGASFVAKSQPDGHTFFIASSPGFTNAAVLSKEAGFDPLKDFVAVAMLGTQGFLFALSATLPPNTVQEFVAYAKANAGKLNYGTPGIGTPHHLGMELFKSMAGIDVVHVPYRGGAPLMQDMLAGQVGMMLGSWVITGAHLKTGKFKAIARTSVRPVSQAPEIRSIAEQGYPDFDVETWFGLVAPVGTPASVLDRLSKEIHALQANEDMRRRMLTVGFDPPPADTVAQFSDRLKRDVSRWSKIVKDVGIKPE